MLNGRKFKSYWIILDLSNNGLIQVGSGADPGKNVLMSWNDPFPWEDIMYIGLGSWDVPVEFRNIRLEGVQKSEGEDALDDEEEEEEDDENLDDLEAEGEDLEAELGEGGEEE